MLGSPPTFLYGLEKTLNLKPQTLNYIDILFQAMVEWFRVFGSGSTGPDGLGLRVRGLGFRAEAKP